MIVSVDAMGYNFHKEEFTPEFIERYQLNPIQVHLLRSGQELTINGCVIRRCDQD